MNKLAKMIESMSYDDLLRLQQDFEKGTLYQALTKQIQVHKDSRLALCPVCSSPIKEGEGYHLQFGGGASGMRKKATFDGKDCLQYFLSKLPQK